MSRGQGAVEFTLISIGMLLLLATGIIVAELRFADLTADREEEAINSILDAIEQEFFFARMGGQGYVRNFTTPQTFYGDPYHVGLRLNQTSTGADELYILYEGKEYLRFLKDPVHGRLGKGEHGVRGGLPIAVGPRLPYAYFNGTTSAQSAYTAGISGGWSIAFWVMPRMPSADESVIFLLGNPGANSLRFRLNQTHALFGYKDAGEDQFNVMNFTPYDGRWVHVVTTYNVSGADPVLRTYLNTALTDTDVFTTPMNEPPITMTWGKYPWGAFSGNEFTGGIYDFRIYTYPVDQAAIDRIYGGEPYGSPWAHWWFDENGGTTTYDEGANPSPEDATFPDGITWQVGGIP